MSKISPERYDKALGVYLGAAIGDAMGGPVESFHAARIQKYYGTVAGLLPYKKPPGLIDLQPGYAMRPEAGAITDDTFIRGDFTRFFLQTAPPRTPAMLAAWLSKNADFTKWWPPMMAPLQRIEKGTITPEEAGLSADQGGGAGWWTPLGIIHAGDPERCAAEVRNLCRIWKAPLEQDLLAGAIAGIAESQRTGATVDIVLQAILAQCGPLATALLERAVTQARKATSADELTALIYANCLVDKMPKEADAPLPPPLKPAEYTDDVYVSILFAEQIPLALAAFVYGAGDPAQVIPLAVNFGRDCDSVATTAGSWAGGLAGEKCLPAGWVRAVCEVNREDMDIRGMAERLLEIKE